MKNYGAFKFKAVVDWIEIQVTLAGPTQPRHVRDRIRRSLPHWNEPPYIHALTDAPSRTASTIQFRVQDPAGPAALMRDVQALARPGDTALTDNDVQIIGVEIALDAYSPGQDHDALIGMALHMFRHHARPPAQQPGTVPVIVGPIGYRAADGWRDTVQGLTDGFTIKAGDPDGDHRARYYVKTTDSADGGSYATLPVQQHRARMEVTMRGAALPFHSIGAWRAFKFGSLTRHFGMRYVLPSANSDEVQARVPRFGRPIDAKTIRNRERSTRFNTRADAAWAEVSRNALRALERSQAKG